MQIVLGRSWFFGEYVCELAHRVSAPEQIGVGGWEGRSWEKNGSVLSSKSVCIYYMNQNDNADPLLDFN